MDSRERLTATRYIWVAFVFGLFLVNANVILNSGSLDWGNLIGMVLISVACMISTGFVWRWGFLPATAREESHEKIKRDARIEKALNMLNEDDLKALQQRLSDEYQNEEMNMILSDDGELVQRQAR